MIAPTALAVFCQGHPEYCFRLDDVIDRVVARTIDFNTWESAWEGISCCREQLAEAAVQTEPISTPIPLQKPQWQYLDGDHWRPAADEYTMSLEHACNLGHSSCEVTVGHHIYDVDVEKHTQRNRATGVERSLRRVMVVDRDATVSHLRIIHALQQEQIACLSKQLSEQQALSQQFFGLVAAGTEQMERLAKHLSEHQALSQELSKRQAEDQEQIKMLSQQLSEQQAFYHNQLSEQRAANQDQNRMRRSLLQKLSEKQALCNQLLEQKAADQEQIKRLSKQLSEQQLLSQALSEHKAIDNSKIQHLGEQLCKQRALAEKLSKQKAEEQGQMRFLSQHLSAQRAQCQQLSEQKAEYQEQNRRLSQELLKQQLPDVDTASPAGCLLHGKVEITRISEIMNP
ncbi:unnamed protein product, partial [Symbiodinium necroappetens]